MRKNIIGRTLRACGVHFSTGKGVRDMAGAFALLQEQAGHGGVGLVRKPLVQQGVAALERRDNSKLCKLFFDAESRKSQGGSVLKFVAITSVISEQKIIIIQ